MLIHKNNEKHLYEWKFQLGYISDGLHALPNIGYSETILTQVKTSFFMFEYAVVASDCLPGDTGLGTYLANCRIGKERTLLLKQYQCENTAKLK